MGRVGDPQPSTVYGEYQIALSGAPSLVWMQHLLEHAQQSTEGRELNVRIEADTILFVCPGDEPQLLPQYVALLDQLIAASNGERDPRR